MKGTADGHGRWPIPPSDSTWTSARPMPFRCPKGDSARPRPACPPKTTTPIIPAAASFLQRHLLPEHSQHRAGASPEASPSYSGRPCHGVDMDGAEAL